jgi:uroporphyrinogen decarboxylase
VSLLREALSLRPVPHPPVWIMRQAGRYLPEYREIRRRHSFQEMVRRPDLAAEVTIQPIRRFELDGAVIFADIMTPLEAMGVEMTFDPGPKLAPLSLSDVAGLPELDIDRVSHVGETIRRVRGEVGQHVSVIGFAGAPVTLLAYLLEGGGSKEFMTMRAAVRAQPELARQALDKLARSMNAYLRHHVASGADVVQLFDTWAGMLDRETFAEVAVPAARGSLTGVGAPSIYFAPGAGHTLDSQKGVGASGYGVDWRTPIEDAFDSLPGNAIQGNLDPAILLAEPGTIQHAVKDLLTRVGGRPGHIMNLGHGIDQHTPPENVSVFVEAVRS